MHKESTYSDAVSHWRPLRWPVWFADFLFVIPRPSEKRFVSIGSKKTRRVLRSCEFYIYRNLKGDRQPFRADMILLHSLLFDRKETNLSIPISKSAHIEHIVQEWSLLSLEK